MALKTFEILNSHNYLIFTVGVEDWNAAGWIFSEITFKAGIFSGSVSSEFNLEDFITLRSQLSNFYNDLEGEFIFHDSDKNCQLNVGGDGTGDFSCEIIIYDQKQSKAALHYELQFNRTQIDGMIMQLNRIISDYS